MLFNPGDSFLLLFNQVGQNVLSCTLTAKDAAKTISQCPKILQKTNAPAKSNILAQCIDWGARSKIGANIGTENDQPKRSQRSARTVSSTFPMQRLKINLRERLSRERDGCMKFGTGGLDPGERYAVGTPERHTLIVQLPRKPSKRVCQAKLKLLDWNI